MQKLSLTFSTDRARIARGDGVAIDSACNDAERFSPTELLAAALAACIAMRLSPLLARHDVSLNSGRIEIVSHGPLRDGFIVHIALPRLDEALLQRCRRAAETCPVRLALKIPVEFLWIRE